MSLSIAPAPGAGEEHDRLVVAADGSADDVACLLPKPGGLQAGPTGLGACWHNEGGPPRIKSSMKVRLRPEAVQSAYVTGGDRMACPSPDRRR